MKNKSIEVKLNLKIVEKGAQLTLEGGCSSLSGPCNSGNETGLTAPVGDDARLAALAQKLLADEALQRKLTANARQLVQQFSRAATAEATLSEYEGLAFSV